MEEIINVNGENYRILSDKVLSEEQKIELMNKIKNNTIKLSPATCPSTGKNVGQIVTLSATPTGGTAPYKVEFRRNGVAISGGTFTGIGEGVIKTLSYTFITGDTPSVTLSVFITDSCAGGAKTNSEQCVVMVSAACVVPSCNFTIT